MKALRTEVTKGESVVTGGEMIGILVDSVLVFFGGLMGPGVREGSFVGIRATLCGRGNASMVTGIFFSVAMDGRGCLLRGGGRGSPG